MPGDESTNIITAGSGGDPDHPDGAGLPVARRMSIVQLFLLAALLGIIVGGGASYALRELHL
jgi:hypothetical protein